MNSFFFPARTQGLLAPVTRSKGRSGRRRFCFIAYAFLSHVSISDAHPGSGSVGDRISTPKNKRRMKTSPSRPAVCRGAEGKGRAPACFKALDLRVDRFKWPPFFIRNVFISSPQLGGKNGEAVELSLGGAGTKDPINRRRRSGGKKAGVNMITGRFPVIPLIRFRVKLSQLKR